MLLSSHHSFPESLAECLRDAAVQHVPRQEIRAFPFELLEFIT